MVIIKTTCPKCGEVDLTAEKVELRIAIGGKGTSYSFDCPSCTDRVLKPADARIAQLLISGGVAPEIITDERSDAEPKPAKPARPQAPALTYDDLLEFHRQLESGVLEKFLRNAAA
jgi:hypothetical protein